MERKGRRRFLGITLLFAFGGLAMPGWRLAQPPYDQEPNSTPMPPQSQPLKLKLSLDKKVYKTGEPIEITFEVINESKTPQHLVFSTTQKYDFEILSGKDLKAPLLWRWSQGRLFGQIVTQQTLQPGDKLCFKETIPPKDEKHLEGLPPLKPGTYLLVAVLTTMPRTARPSVSCLFQVK